MFRAKKLVLVLIIFASIIELHNEDGMVLERILCIYYPFRFGKDTVEKKILINVVDKVNAITLA